MTRVPVAISNRHIYLSQKHTEILFGKNFEFTKSKNLSQPGKFAAKEYVTLIGPKGEIPKVRVLGPGKKQTQVNILMMDTFKLGIDIPIEKIGDSCEFNSITIVGPEGKIILTKGIMIAKRSLHMTVAEAKDFGLKNNQIIKIKIGNKERGLVFDNVIVQIRDDYVLDFHIDREEANAAGISQGARGEIVE